ncbi:5'-deoxynucleotidase [Marinagarivorans cellulosilyticus]|uniref:5'-deoxynucleotidase n=1 Tax=Marinagarivorans cellulosilyticus TaxID=2721545 RepID=A0AAN1WHS0_9GAMM|nr:5'-deoxynucleotidase [Marinagarivorans cellulosilyticus]BCD97843.1 5'-deoxynucleotidase [Marinagarivorans cellulosilyticus]
MSKAPISTTKMQSHFFAYISKIRWVIRWGLKRNAIPENVMEHSWEVATIAHALAVLSNSRFGGQYDANLVATTALYHDVSEVITGDMPTPIKYHSKGMQKAFKEVEIQAERELIALLPEDMKAAFTPLVVSSEVPAEVKRLIKGADTLAAFLKCQEELKAGNSEFSKAAQDIAARLAAFNMPEVDTFLGLFAPSYKLTLDELLNGRETVRALNQANEG